ncbi:MAG: hypothetical protein GY750_16140 [Lentisphaerae bacterium]|nr:hypothetical protein [Lentisphaerota bacterium]MCP4102926.1 hypothetical protein [Lentisphaerota bacterium]
MTNTELTMFNFEDANVRVINRDEEPWFVAKDVCEVLGLSSTAETIRSLYEDEVSNIKKTDIRDFGDNERTKFLLGRQKS